jgi:hypothetical protein
MIVGCSVGIGESPPHELELFPACGDPKRGALTQAEHFAIDAVAELPVLLKLELVSS